MYNKKGQGLSTNAIILIVLGIFVLIILILGFTLGWGKLAPWINQPNVKDIVQGCTIACSTTDKFGFCSAKKELKAEDVKLEDVTCNYLLKEQTRYGIQKCDAILCEDVLFVNEVKADKVLDADDCVEDATFTAEQKSEKTIQNLTDNKLLTFNCP